jgi:hypothetical protein
VLGISCQTPRHQVGLDEWRCAALPPTAHGPYDAGHASEEWLQARLELLQLDKDLTRHRDAVNTARRSLPMVVSGLTAIEAVASIRRASSDSFPGQYIGRRYSQE